METTTPKGTAAKADHGGARGLTRDAMRLREIADVVGRGDLRRELRKIADNVAPKPIDRGTRCAWTGTALAECGCPWCDA